MMHTPFERILEIIFFTVINTVPYHLCALYPFRKDLRFSPPVTLAVLPPVDLTEATLVLLEDHVTVRPSRLLTISAWLSPTFMMRVVLFRLAAFLGE